MIKEATGRTWFGQSEWEQQVFSFSACSRRHQPLEGEMQRFKGVTENSLLPGEYFLSLDFSGELSAANYQRLMSHGWKSVYPLLSQD